jgi:hypothetical protein
MDPSQLPGILWNDRPIAPSRHQIAHLWQLYPKSFSAEQSSARNRSRPYNVPTAIAFIHLHHNHHHHYHPTARENEQLFYNPSFFDQPPAHPYCHYPYAPPASRDQITLQLSAGAEVDFGASSVQLVTTRMQSSYFHPYVETSENALPDPVVHDIHACDAEKRSSDPSIKQGSSASSSTLSPARADSLWQYLACPVPPIWIAALNSHKSGPVIQTKINSFRTASANCSIYVIFF